MQNSTRKRLLEMGVVLAACVLVTLAGIMIAGGKHATQPLAPIDPLVSPLRIDKSVDKSFVQTDEPFTYTIMLTSIDGDAPAFVTDTLPAGVTPNLASFTYTAGIGNLSMGPPAMITWTGNLITGEVVMLVVQVSSPLILPTAITNTAVGWSPDISSTSGVVTTIVEPLQIFLPIFWGKAYRVYLPEVGKNR